MSSDLRVLVVENEQATAAAMGRALERRGHRVSLALSAEAALSLPAHPLLVCAVELKGLDGFELLHRLRKRGESPRAVLLSGDPSFEACQQALRTGAYDVFAKPVRLSELVRAVELAGRRDNPPADPHSTVPSTVQSNGWRREYCTAPDLPERAARDLVAYALRCGIGPSARARIGTALAELIENAMVHAYPGGDGSIEIEAHVETRQLRVCVRDHGLGFDSLSAFLMQSPGGCEGGLGRIAALAEEMSLDSRPGVGTEVRLEFCVTRSKFGDQNKIDLSELDYLAPETARAVIEAIEASEGEHSLHISPAMAVTIGRLLSGPDPRRGLQTALGR